MHKANKQAILLFDFILQPFNAGQVESRKARGNSPDTPGFWGREAWHILEGGGGAATEVIIWISLDK